MEDIDAFGKRLETDLDQARRPSHGYRAGE